MLSQRTFCESFTWNGQWGIFAIRAGQAISHPCVLNEHSLIWASAYNTQ